MDSVKEKCSIPLNQQDPQPLEKVPDLNILLLASAPLLLAKALWVENMTFDAQIWKITHLNSKNSEIYELDLKYENINSKKLKNFDLKYWKKGRKGMGDLLFLSGN